MERQLTLDHMPDHFKKSIVNSLDPVSKVSMRQVSKVFEGHVRKSPTRYEELNIKISPNLIRIQLIMVENGPTLEIVFVKMKDAYYTTDADGNVLKTVDEGKFEIGAIMHLARIFNHPKTIVNDLQLDFFDWESTQKLKPSTTRIAQNPLGILKTMSDSLKKAKTRLAAESVWISFGGEETHMIALLSLLNPKPLKNIIFQVNPVVNVFMELVNTSENEWRFKRRGTEDNMMIKYNDMQYSIDYT